MLEEIFVFVQLMAFGFPIRDSANEAPRLNNGLVQRQEAFKERSVFKEVVKVLIPPDRRSKKK